MYGFLTKYEDSSGLEQYGIEMSKVITPQTKKLSLHLRDAIVSSDSPEDIACESVLALVSVKEVVGKVSIFQSKMFLSIKLLSNHESRSSIRNSSNSFVSFSRWVLLSVMV